MTNLLADGATWLSDQLQNNAGTSAVYWRDTAASDSITVTRSPRIHQIENAEGLLQNIRRDAFIVKASDLVIGGETIEPRSGDRVVIGTEQYEVMPPDDGTPAFEPSDSSGVMLVVHAKRTR